jgi:hypothetical protein
MSWITVIPSRTGSSHSVYEKYYGQPIVAVNNRFNILLSPASIEMLGCPQYVTVHHDPTLHLMGISASVETDMLRLKITISKTLDKNGNRIPSKGMASISCLAAKELAWGKEDHIVIYRAKMDSYGVLAADVRFPVEVIPSPKRHTERKNGHK